MTTAHDDLIERLRQEGFEYLTDWTLRQTRIKLADTSFDTCSGWIYAFVAEGLVRYIGIATTILRSRFDGYSYQINDTVGRNIRQLLEAGERVQVFGIRCPGTEKADLLPREAALIAALDPDWNVQR